MPSLIGTSRMRSLFAPPGDIGPKLPKRFVSNMMDPPDWSTPQDDEPSEAEKYFRASEDLRTRMKAGPARTAYMQGIAEQPRQEQFQPSKKRRFGAAIAGALTGLAEGPTRGAQAAEQFIDTPYQLAQRDYQQRMKGLSESAKLEEADFREQMENMINAQKFGLDYKKYLADVEDKRLGRQIQRDTLGETSRYHTGVLQNQQTANTNRNQYYTDTVGVRRRANELTAARDKNTANFQSGTLADRARRTQHIIDSGGPKPPTATQQRAAVDNVLRELARNPAFAKYVKKDTNGFYDYAPPDEIEGGTNTEMYREFEKAAQQGLMNSLKTGLSFMNFGSLDDEDDDGSIVIGNPFIRK